MTIREKVYDTDSVTMKIGGRRYEIVTKLIRDVNKEDRWLARGYLYSRPFYIFKMEKTKIVYGTKIRQRWSREEAETKRDKIYAELVKYAERLEGVDLE